MGIFTPVRKAGGYLIAPANLPGIRQQWDDIRVLAGSVHRSPRLVGQFVVGADYRIDFEASASVHRAVADDALSKGVQPQEPYLAMSSITAEELQLVVLNQRRKAAQRAWIFGSACILFTGAWVWKALSQPEQYASLFYVAVWLMIVVSLAALAFVEMWRNWNLRTGCLAPISAFIRTEDSWMPS